MDVTTFITFHNMKKTSDKILLGLSNGDKKQVEDLKILEDEYGNNSAFSCKESFLDSSGKAYIFETCIEFRSVISISFISEIKGGTNE